MKLGSLTSVLNKMASFSRTLSTVRIIQYRGANVLWLETETTMVLSL